MNKYVLLTVITLLLSSCKNNLSPENNIPYDYSIDQVKFWADQYSGKPVRVYSKADTIADLRWISDSSQLPIYLWRDYRTLKGLSDEAGKWDTVDYVIVDTLDPVYHYPRYLSVHAKIVLPGGAAFTFVTSNIVQNK